MKLRIRGDSIRLRLTQTEVRQLVERGRVEERTRLGLLPGESLAYGVEAGSAATGIVCSWANGRLLVTVPPATLAAWASGPDLALEASQPVAEGATLRILVEKDLACAKPRPDEDDSDAFPNPATCGET